MSGGGTGYLPDTQYLREKRISTRIEHVKLITSLTLSLTHAPITISSSVSSSYLHNRHAIELSKQEAGNRCGSSRRNARVAGGGNELVAF